VAWSDLQRGILEEFTRCYACVKPDVWKMYGADGFSISIPEEDDRAIWANYYHRNREHLIASRVAKFKNRTPEQKAHDSKMLKARVAKFSPEKRRKIQDQKNAHNRAARARARLEQKLALK